MSPRKRRRDQAFSEDEVKPQVTVEEETALEDKKREEKEQEVWDAIREAHYEAIEQLPLTLQRQLSLMKKLDEQSIALTSRLYPTLQKYIQQRQAMAEISENEAKASDLHALNINGVSDVESDPSTQINGHPHKNGESAEALSHGLHNGASRPSPRTSTPDSLNPDSQKDLGTTRELLSHVAWISEELLRASQEKVNLAQTNHDSVERHIRLLDQAIKEQVASLSLEKSQSTNSIAIHLPEVVIPEWHRKYQTTVPSDDELQETYEKEVQAPVTEKTKSRSKTSQRNSKKKGKESIKAGQDEQSKDAISLTITLPATTQQDDIANEEFYCYCNRVSFGEMIACDNEFCEREWFHLGCVGLTESPAGEWFCEDCRDDEA